MSDDKLIPHQPEHPLPEEIQRMTRDETVCKFCGVSYLIHNEIKALEDKLRATEAELAHYKGLESREEALKEQVRNLEDQCRNLEQNNEKCQERIRSLEDELKECDERLHSLDRRRQDLESMLTAATKNTDKYRSKYELLTASLPNVKTQLNRQKAELQQLSSSLDHQRSSFPEEYKRVQNMVVSSCTKIFKERDSLATKVAELQQNCQSSASAESDLQSKIKGLQTEAEQLKSVAKEATSLKYTCDSLHSKVKDLQTEIEVLKNTKDHLTLEGVQYQEQIKTKASEIDNLVFQMRTKENTAQQNMTSLERKFAEKNTELSDTIYQLRTLQHQFDTHQRNEAEMQRKASQTSVEASELKERLDRCRGDMEALKSEREMMISAHQTQIEQLRESFKQRIYDADQWPAKLDAAVKKEKQKHAREIHTLEDKLKENFVMELEIEKQKHQKLLDKCVAETRASEKQLRAELGSIESRHKGELTDLHKQLAEFKARAREMENSLREEIQSLKNIIKDLESRLARFDSSNDTLVSQLKDQVFDIERQLEDAKQITKMLQTQRNASKEEILFLQETVRKECEERFELTEALSIAKEELLAFKRPAGGYPNGVTPRRISEDMQPTDIASARSSASSNSRPTKKKSEEMLIFRKSSAQKRPPHPPANSRAAADVSPSVSVNYDGDVAKVPGKGIKGTLNDSRRRIAQAVGRP